ncbi:MAG TPA: CBS domain-containing protein [Candidatus Limnocylindrales bacterium]
MRTTGITVAEVMTRDVITVGPDMPLKAAATVISERGVSGVPVCEEDGTVVGVLSESDLLVKQSGARPRGGLFSLLAESREPADLVKAHAHTAGRAMTAPAITIASDATVTEAARLMSERNLNRLPVLDAGRLVGIVTRADLVRLFTRSDEDIAREIREGVARKMLWIEPDRLRVVVETGEVLLTGSVDTQTEEDMLLKLVPLVPGVVGVRSELRWEIDRSGRSRAAVEA